ncbi:MAG: GNAT family N-acetyltransferase [Candidatus Levybacteria bacterium]|nr:GNAT family N-acetyltransferase [Candidatus Levybacteria bacterium]
MKLVKPSVKYKQQYLLALKETKIEKVVTTLEKPGKNQDFEDFVKKLVNRSKGLNLPKGWIPGTELWLIDKGEFIGRVSIRHWLTDHLLKIGGHIGYYIHPSKRKMGYGKKILELALKEAKKLGISKALVTCDDTNIGSQKIIKANGGILENIIEVAKGKPKKHRYWINLN